MRLACTLALAALLSSPSAAQSQYADSTGGYLALHELGFGSGGARGIDGTLGRRLRGGLDVGLRLGYSSYGTGSDVSGGPVVGITRPVGRGFVGRVEGALHYASWSATFTSLQDAPEGEVLAFAQRSLAEDVTATLARPVRLVGSLRLRPTLGVYATAAQRLTYTAPERFRNADGTRAAAGLHIEIPLTFRLFGQDASVAAVGRLPIVGDRLNDLQRVEPACAGGGLRMNF